MAFFIDHFFWVLIVSGLLTLSMMTTALNPGSGFKIFFGTDMPDHPAVALVVRNWAALIAAGGVLLIYAAFDPSVRPAVLSFIGFGKAIFAALVFAGGAGFRGTQAFLAAILDSIMVVLFALYLIVS